MSDPLAHVERWARPLRAAASGAKARWLLLSRFGFEFLGAAVARERPEEIAGLGTLRRAQLGNVALLALDRPADQSGEAGDAAGDALAVFAAGRAGLRGVIQCIAAASLEERVAAPTFALVRDWLRWSDEDPLRGGPAAQPGARFPDLRGLSDADETRRVAARLRARSIPAAVAVARHGPSGATRAELEAMRRLGGELVVEAGAAERIAALQQGLRGVTLALVLDAALQSPPADPGALAAAADALLPKLAPLLGEVLALLDEAEQAEGSR